MNREILEKPFAENVIKKRAGRGGKKWNYVKTGNIIQRLNAGFESMWSFEVVESLREGDEIIVLGKLSYDGITKQQYGGKKIETYTKGSLAGEVISIADDYKSAASDALKKCATMFGVALDLYVDVSEQERPEQGDTDTERPNTQQGDQNGADGANKPHKETALTSRVRALAKECGYDDLKIYLNHSPKELSTKQWSELEATFKKYKAAAE